MVKLKEYKHLTQNHPIEKARLPSRVFIPLLQHVGKLLDRLEVKVADHVKRGQRLATSDGGFFAPVHASISGVVKAILEYPHPVLGFCRTVEIDGDDQDEAIEGPGALSDEEVSRLEPEELKKKIFEAGCVGLGGAAFPTHIKLSPKGAVEDFIVNGAECEPYLTADERLMVEKSDEIAKGMGVVVKIIRPRNCYIAIEDDKPEAVKRMREAGKSLKARVIVLKSSYPQGGEKQLIKSCLNKEVPSGRLPLDVGALVQNVGTLYAIYEAVYLNKPLYERVVTVTGTSLAHPKNLLVRIGTPLRELIEFCGPLTDVPKKVVMGGPMTGIAQCTLEAPVIKGTSGILVLKEADIKDEELFCVRCAECLMNCPMGLNPGLIAMAISKDKLDLAEELGVLDCIECGLCAYLCPAQRKIVQAIKTAKARIRNAKTKK